MPSLPLKDPQLSRIKKLLRALRAEPVGQPGPAETAAAIPLRELGFRQPEDSARHLRRLVREMPARTQATFVRRALPELARSPDPDQALVNLARLAESRHETEAHRIGRLAPASLAMLARLFGASQFLADLLIRYPQDLEWLERDPELGSPRPVRQMTTILNAAANTAEAPQPRRLAAIRAMRRELLRLTVRRLMDLSDEMEMARELSDLATATLLHALEEVTPPLVARFGQPLEESTDEDVRASARRAGFVVIAMGKLGGRELNFSSDIDLIFVYSDEGRTTGRQDATGRITNHVFYSRLAEALIAYVSEPSEEGYFYRVDTRLRPDGETGPLVRSISAYEIYYETQARLWERLALIKARAVAGDPALGRAFESMSRPLVFDPLHASELVGQMYDLKQRIDHEIGRRAGAEREIKRGAGGIRELEFLVQTMQILHGAHDTRLGVTGTLEAIERLRLAGLLPPERAEQMAQDYLFLRTLEHRLQMEQLRQTHMLPEDPRALDILALRCGLTPAPGEPENEPPGRLLLRRWGEISRRVHRDFKLFFDPAENGSAQDIETGGDPAQQAAARILSRQPESTLLPILAPFGITSAGALKALRRMGGLGRQMYLAAEGAHYYRQLLPLILRACRTNPQPEVALANLESFLGASGALASYYAAFLQNPPVLELLLLAFGSGSALAQTLIAHPEFLDYLADPSLFATRVERQAMQKLLNQWTAKALGADRFAAALARLKRFEFLLAGLGEIAGLLDYPASCQRLTTMADVVTAQALSRSAREMDLAGPPDKFAVLAMGKLGSGELNYYSDLDLIFVWDEGFAPGHASPAEAAAELGNRVIALLTYPTPEGTPFNVDARLRPEGQNAPLAPPLSRYAEYYADRAQTWEFQSAMKLRPIAGDLELARRTVARLGELIVRRIQGREADLAGEIRAMRLRMEAALKLPRWVHCDYKTGPGGTVDLEFIAQYLQLRHLAEDPALMGLGPLAVFTRLMESGRLDVELGEALTQDYVWLRRLERRARLLFESEKSQIPAGGEKLAALERACEGLVLERAPDGHSLLEVLTTVLRRNRRHFDQLLA